jgi:hypothetical protein
MTTFVPIHATTKRNAKIKARRVIGNAEDLIIYGNERWVPYAEGGWLLKAYDELYHGDIALRRRFDGQWFATFVRKEEDYYAPLPDPEGDEP